VLELGEGIDLTAVGGADVGKFERGVDDERVSTTVAKLR
jgi:hypothetical protein